MRVSDGILGRSMRDTRCMSKQPMHERWHLSDHRQRLSMRVSEWLQRSTMRDQYVDTFTLLPALLLPCVEDACAPNPCLNGGRCVPNDFGGFSCVCPAQYTGQRCEDSKHCAWCVCCSVVFRFARARRSLCFSAVLEPRQLCERGQRIPMCVLGGVLGRAMRGPRCVSKQSVHEWWNVPTEQ